MAFAPYLVATPIFFALGAMLVYFVVTPNLLHFFLAMQQSKEPGRAQIELLPRVSEYMSLIMTLIFAFGAGAEAREVLGWIIVGGLGLATIATLYITPVAYLLLAGLSKPKAAETALLRRELADAAERSSAA
jgi:sec-independent protein translocase protein TatC